MKAGFWTHVDCYMYVNEWDRNIRKYLRKTRTRGFTVSMHGRKANKDMKEEARKYLFGRDNS